MVVILNQMEQESSVLEQVMIIFTHTLYLLLGDLQQE